MLILEWACFTQWEVKAISLYGEATSKITSKNVEFQMILTKGRGNNRERWFC